MTSYNCHIIYIIKSNIVIVFVFIVLLYTKVNNFIKFIQEDDKSDTRDFTNYILLCHTVILVI